MKRKKKVTRKVLKANCRNAQKSTGPKTGKGKQMSSKNAIKHGFFCRGRDVYVAEADREEYQALQNAIYQQLKPSTPLQHISAGAVVAAAWRYEQASQLHAQAMQRRLAGPSGEDTPAPEKPTLMQWYGSNLRAMNAALRFIDEIIPEVRTGGRVPSWATEPLTKMFGEDFCVRLTEWETEHMVNLQVVHNMIAKSRAYDLNLKAVMDHVEEDPDAVGGLKVVPDMTHNPVPVVMKDPKERADMMAKLLEQKREQLLELRHILKHAGGEVNSGEDASVQAADRHLNSAFKQLVKAINAYLHVVEAGL